MCRYIGDNADIDGEKGAQISILARKRFFNEDDPPDYDYGIQASYRLHLFFIFSLLCSYYVADMIKILELRLVVVLVVANNG